MLIEGLGTVYGPEGLSISCKWHFWVRNRKRVMALVIVKPSLILTCAYQCQQFSFIKKEFWRTHTKGRRPSWRSWRRICVKIQFFVAAAAAAALLKKEAGLSKLSKGFCATLGSFIGFIFTSECSAALLLNLIKWTLNLKNETSTRNTKTNQEQKKVNVVASWMKNGLRTKRIRTNNTDHYSFKGVKY